MMSDNDGIDDALRSATQVAAGLVARAAELQARERETAARQHEHQLHIAGEDAARQMSRTQAEQQAAHARLALVHDPAWWQTASASDIAHSWTIASAARPSQDTATAIGVMRRELAARYSITPGSRTTADELERPIDASVTHHRRAERERSVAVSERTQARNLDNSADVEHGRAAEASKPSGHALDRPGPETDEGVNESDEAREKAADFDRRAADGYDSAEQREARARHYEASGNARAAEARRVADTAEGVSAIYATTGRTKSRRRRGRTPNLRGPRTPQRHDHGR